MKKHLFLILLLTVGFTIIAPTTHAKTAKPVLSKKTATIYVGNSITLKLKNAKKSKVKWSSTQKSVASVSRKGTITGKKAGKATITAKYAGKKYKSKVTVKTSCLNTKSITLIAGESQKLIPTLTR